MKETLLFMLVAVSVLAACTKPPSDRIDAATSAASVIDFAYVSVGDGRIRTLHDLKYVVSMNADFHVIPPKSRVARFNSTPYRISLAAFINEDSSLMIHAEEVADASGASDYSHLAPTDWPDATFRSSGPDCLEIPGEEVDGEHDLLWLRKNGFEPSGSFVYAQYYATTDDMNSELVISMLQRVASCAEASNHSEIIREFQAKVSITRVE